jgi:hypothetical protein
MPLLKLKKIIKFLIFVVENKNNMTAAIIAHILKPHEALKAAGCFPT